MASPLRVTNRASNKTSAWTALQSHHKIESPIRRSIFGICERSIPMSSEHSDALVFYGVTGDLAFKKIFPALQAMVRRGHLNVPVVGVARSAWTVDQLRQRVRDSLEKHGGVDPLAFEKLSRLLRYVSVD